ncbi:MAG: SEC-C domain-containing protein [Xanthomonadaceae bacterium]|nr:SEC-C domain-containing protein [Xanthomonadaceae bacterium]
MREKTDIVRCPCGTGRAYAQCCGRYHAGEDAPDAERLMRARYSAYVMGDTGYLLASWHPGTRPARSELEEPPGAPVAWLGLTVECHRATSETAAEVEFLVRYRRGGGRAVRMREHSRFIRENGIWFYLDALGIE